MNESLENTPRYQQSLAESYEAPKVFSQAERKGPSKEQVVKMYLDMQNNDFFQKHGFQMSGSQKRTLKRKLEKLFDKGQLKLANLNG